MTRRISTSLALAVAAVAAVLAAVFALGTAGCIRLSDPIYAFMPLHADEPGSPASSLLLVSVDFDEVSLTSLSSIYFRRVDPDGGTSYVYVTKDFLFRVFERRQVKSGHFLLEVQPGVYELDRLEGYSWTSAAPVRYLMQEDARLASRIYITRPGVYDLGKLEIVSPTSWLGGSYSIRAEGDAGSPARRKLLEDAIAGTGWERLYQAQEPQP